MDSLSQALWGALSSQATQKKRRGQVPAWLMGLVAGTLPDLDSFISSSADPLLATLMHRHFTHSIFFIPIGAVIVWLIFWPFFKDEKENYRNYYLIAVFGYGTHWILDVMTSYGTLILWPLNTTRYALDWLSIVDPFLTIPWLAALIFFLSHKNQKWIYSVLIYSALYTSYCGFLHSQARSAYSQYLAQQGDRLALSRERIRLLPTLGNSFWYRAISVDNEYIYATGIFIDPLTHKKYFREGDKVTRWRWNEKDFQNPETQRQIKIWSWFVDDYLYIESESPLSLGDGRYSTLANGFNSLWVLILDLENPQKTIKTSPTLQKSARDRSPFEGYNLFFERKDLTAL